MSEFDAAVSADKSSSPTYVVAAIQQFQRDAGAALFYALYHSGSATVLALPKPVLDAYAVACTAYDPRGYRLHRRFQVSAFPETPDTP